MPAFPLLWPIIAMAALTFVVWFVLVVQRMAHLKANPPRREDLATGDSSRRYFEPVARPADNLANLFEMPVLFFVVAVLLIVTELANDVQVMLAWAYVAVRAVHSVFHLRGQVKQRFFSYLLSMAVLLAMWVGFTVDAVQAGVAYNQTVATLEAEALAPR